MNPNAPLPVRLLVTATGGLLAAFGVVEFARLPANLDTLSAALLCAVFGLTPWVALDRPNRWRGLLGVLVAVAFLLMGWMPLSGGRSYPRTCDPEGFVCQLENALHGIGGAPLAAAPGMLFGLFVMVLSVRTIASDRRARD